MQKMKIKSGYKKVKLFSGKYEIIPESWDILPIENLVDENRKVTYGIVQPGKYDPNGVLLIRGQDYLKKSWVSRDKFFRVDRDLHNQYIRSLTKKGDILLCIVGSVGIASQVPNWITEANITQTTARISCNKEKIEPRFLLYFLNSSIGRKQSLKFTKGSVQPGLNLKDVEKFFITVPPLNEQKKIVFILDNLEYLIKNLDSLIDHTNQITRGLTKQLFTKGLHHSKFKTVDLGIRSQKISVPESWDMVELKSISEHITKGATPTTYGYKWSEKSDDVLFIRNECVKENSFNVEGSLRITPEAHEFMSRSKVIPGDILISITGEIGKTCIFPDIYGEANINQHIARIRINSSKVLSSYVVNLLNSTKYKNFFYTINQGLTHPHLSLGQIQDTWIPLPSFKEQEKIVSILSNLYSKIKCHESKKFHYLQTKERLTERFLTSELRVKT